MTFQSYTESLLTTDSDLLETKYIGFFPALMNIINSLTGPEVLNVSNSITLSGYYPSIIMMVFTTMLSYYGTILILNMRHRVNAESINELATKIAGNKGGYIYSILTLVFTYSSQVAYLIIGAETVTSTLKKLKLNTSKYIIRAAVVLVYSLFPVSLTFPREIKVLSYISSFAVLFQLLYVCVVFYETYHYLSNDHHYNQTTENYIIDINMIKAFSIFSQLYAFPSVVLPLIREYNPCIKKRYFLIGTSFMCCFFISIVPGVLGYFIKGADVKEIIYQSFDDIPMNIVRYGFFVIVNSSFSLNSINVLQDLSSLIFKEQNPGSLSFKRRSLLLVIANVPVVIFAIIMPNARPAFEIGGAFGGCLSNFAVPPILAILEEYYRELRKFSFSIAMYVLFALFGIVSGAIGTYQAVLEAIEDIKGSS